MSTQTFNADTCLCNEKYTCNDLSNAYGKSTCPEQNYGLTPYTSPLDNCACQSQAEYDAMYNYEFAGHCAHAPAFKKTQVKVNKIRVCKIELEIPAKIGQCSVYTGMAINETNSTKIEDVICT